MEAGQALAHRYPVTWETFEELEAEITSLSNSPAVNATADDDFEFHVSAGGGLLPTAATASMCAADEVFFRGQILPLQLLPSVGSDNSVSVFGRGVSRCVSPTTTTTAVSSPGFAANRSSSSCVSRNHSSNDARSISTACERSLSNHLYAHPSPTPRIGNAKKRSTGRRSASSAPSGWGFFRLGVVGAAEMGLYDLNSWRSKSGGVGGRKSDADAAHAKRFDVCGGSEAKYESETGRFVRRGLGCKCSPEAVEPIPPWMTKVVIGKKKEEEKDKVSLRRESRMCRSRIMEWLEPWRRSP
ncbi:hypothetical protein Cni_G22928 [Canna indica]|uniref:Uncharacterized protein n=1 Tax=Canna indica TaxID=4628 RepID=A0AAQ3KSH1_9LILI|nr:hypothetical protein Cni_G22928 [Canna indica]